jgi:hypothetical protein
MEFLHQRNLCFAEMVSHRSTTVLDLPMHMCANHEVNHSRFHLFAQFSKDAAKFLKCAFEF